MIADYLSKRYELHSGCNQLPFDRRELIRIFGELGYRVGLEIGVNNGRFAQFMCETIPDLKYYGVDPYNRYDDFQLASTRMMEKSYQKSIAKLIPFDATIVKTFSALAYSKFEDSYFDFIYVDGNHDFNYVFSDILLWLPKIRKGGVMSGHDYLEEVGVKPAVDFCIKSFRIDQWFLCNDTSWFWSVEE